MGPEEKPQDREDGDLSGRGGGDPRCLLRGHLGQAPRGPGQLGRRQECLSAGLISPLSPVPGTLKQRPLPIPSGANRVRGLARPVAPARATRSWSLLSPGLSYFTVESERGPDQNNPGFHCLGVSNWDNLGPQPERCEVLDPAWTSLLVSTMSGHTRVRKPAPSHHAAFCPLTLNLRLVFLSVLFGLILSPRPVSSCHCLVW